MSKIKYEIIFEERTIFDENYEELWLPNSVGFLDIHYSHLSASIVASMAHFQWCHPQLYDAPYNYLIDTLLLISYIQMPSQTNY